VSTPKPVKVIGYVRVSKEDRQGNGASPEAQRSAIKAEADRRGWRVKWIEDKGISGRSLQRPGIKQALALLANGRAAAIIVARLDRLSRSVHDFSGLINRSHKEGWALVILDPNLDTSTPSGKAMAHMFATFSEYERELIGQRTKEALAVKRAQGVRLGRPPTIPAATVRKIQRLRSQGLTLQAIADRLNVAGTPTPPTHNGSRWYANTVRRVLAREVA
jgi:DNA invertase Pin-like site-specific DNA recombinase